MILEVAILDVKPGQGCEFEMIFGEAQRIIANMPGHVSHQLKSVSKSLTGIFFS